MAKKKDDRNPIEALRWQEYNAAPTIAERYPNVAALTIEMVFHDDSGTAEIDTRTQHYPISQAKTIIRIKCPNYECVRGGFDLTNVVASMINSGERSEEGRLECQGWQDQERVGQYHCLTDLVYKITVEYK